jgi:hypothetical protein
MKRFPPCLAVLTLLVGAAPAAAQDAAPWRLSYFPYLTVTPNDGVMGIARMVWARQAGWGGRIVNTRSVAIDAGYSTRDSWLGRVIWTNPTIADGWRLKAMADIGHDARFGDPDGALEHDRVVGWVDVTRRIAGPVHVALRSGVRRDDFGSDIEGGATDQTDVSVRGALVIDLRDREYEVNNGALLEAGLIAGTAGEGPGYDAAYALGRGYLHPILPLRLSARVGWRQAIVPQGQIAPAIEFPAWEDPFAILGGHRTHRGLATSQLQGDGVAFAGAEVRFDVFNVGELGAVTLLAFVDGARQLRASYITIPEATLPEFDWVVGAGGGIAIRLLRQATLTITAARGDGETRWYVGSGFSW